MRRAAISLQDKKSNLFQVRGIATVDGIQIPFTVYRKSTFFVVHHNGAGAVVVRTKHGILSKYQDRDTIRAQILNAANGWWIDRGMWR